MISQRLRNCLFLTSAAVFAGACSSEVARSFDATAIKTVVLRAEQASSAKVVSGSTAITVSGTPSGGALGYHSARPFWRETSPRRWGLDFVGSQFSDVLVISSKNEISYIHHHYYLESITLHIPNGVAVRLEPRPLSENGAPDLHQPSRPDA